MQDIAEKFEELKTRATNNASRKIRAEERFQASKKRVAEIVQEIKDNGYDDPKELPAIREQKGKELQKELEDLEALLVKQEAILDKMEE